MNEYDPYAGQWRWVDAGRVQPGNVILGDEDGPFEHPTTVQGRTERPRWFAAGDHRRGSVEIEIDVGGKWIMIYGVDERLRIERRNC